jgi:hypothetical protein
MLKLAVHKVSLKVLKGKHYNDRIICLRVIQFELKKPHNVILIGSVQHNLKLPYLFKSHRLRVSVR